MIKIHKVSKSEIKNLIQTFYQNIIDQPEVKTALKFDDAKKYISKATDTIWLNVESDIEFIASCDATIKSVSQVKELVSNGLLATIFYRITNHFYKLGVNNNLKVLKTESFKLMQNVAVETGIDIHPAATIDTGFFIDHGQNVVVGETSVVGKNCTIFNGVILGSKNVVKNTKTGKRHPTLLNNVTVCAGAKILGDITIGNGVFISPNAVVIEDIEDDSEVLIVNQLQVKKKSTNTYLPSQQVIVYGVVPKFKNSVCILGEGFYNPNIVIKLKEQKTVDFEITYWDKNKIIIKFNQTKPFLKHEIKGTRLIVFSNSHKVLVLNSLALEKALMSLMD